MISRLPNHAAPANMGFMPDRKHPGTITYVDQTKGTERVADIATVPEKMRFAITPQGKVPIVKVVASVAGDKRTIQEYGDDGKLYRSTVQLKKKSL